MLHRSVLHNRYYTRIILRVDIKEVEVVAEKEIPYKYKFSLMYFHTVCVTFLNFRNNFDLKYLFIYMVFYIE